MKIAIMGTGGLGGYFGAKLAHAGLDVQFIARGETLRGLRENGLRVNSIDGDFTVQSVQATDNPSNPVDLILLCVKNYDLENALPALLPLVGTETVVLPLLNGVEHIARLQAVLGESHVLGGISLINAWKGTPGVIHHVANLGQYQLEFGEWDGTLSPRCIQIQKLWEQAGVNGIAVTNIVERMWSKLAGICGASVLAVARGDKSKVWMPETRALLHRASAEVVALAHAQHIPIDDTVPDSFANAIDNAPPGYKPSLLVDLEKGNRLEVGATNGFVSRLSKELHIATPTNDFIYACLKPHMNG